MDKNVKVIGKRVLVEKERIDSGGMRLTPALEENGMKNTGKIIKVGQVGLARFFGVKEGAIVHFKKFFSANHETEDSLVFVDVENIMAINE